MQVFVKEKGFYLRLAAIAVPISLQNLINVGVMMADTLMVGRLGEVHLSAVSIANQLGFIYMLFTFGVGSGSGVLVSQYWGKGDSESIRRVITIMYRILFAVSLMFTILAVFFPRQIILIFTPDEEVVAQAVKFLRIVGISYIFTGIANSTTIMLRAVHSVKISLVVYICSLATNVFLNWVLIFGKLGAPALGVEGAAIATCIARFVEFVIVTVYMKYFEKKLCYRAKMLFARKLHILRNFMENALPVVINELIWGAGVATIAVIIGRMGKEFTAANAICTVISQLVSVMMFGVASASAVIVGNTVGKGEYGLARNYANTMMALSLLLGLMSGGVVLLIKTPAISLYNISPLARTYADQIITILSVVVVFVSLACTALIGVLRGGGDTRFVLLMDILFMWCVSIPVGFFVGLYLHWPVWAVYMVIKSDEVFKVIFALLRVAKGNWINDITLRTD